MRLAKLLVTGVFTYTLASLASAAAPSEAELRNRLIKREDEIQVVQP